MASFASESGKGLKSLYFSRSVIACKVGQEEVGGYKNKSWAQAGTHLSLTISNNKQQPHGDWQEMIMNDTFTMELHLHFSQNSEKLKEET